MYPALLLALACVHVCAYVYSSSTTLPLSWSMPGSEVITTESLCRALMWFTTQMHTRTCTLTRRDRDTCGRRHQGQVKTNSAHTLGLVPPFALSQGADSPGVKTRLWFCSATVCALICSHVCHIHRSSF